MTETGESATIATIFSLPGTHTVHNLHVEHPDHNYFASGFLVHNLKATGAQHGGMTTRQIFTAGEGGDREAIIPLDNPRFNVGGVMVLPGRGHSSGAAAMAAFASAAGASSRQEPINVEVNLADGMGWLSDYIEVRVEGANARSMVRQGREADIRRREGRY